MNNQRLFLLGLLFIAALSILAFYTLFLTDIHLFSKPILKTVYFPEAYGLRAGDPVQVSGLRIGRVKELDFDINAEPKKRIKALLSLEKEVELLQGASITIQESTLLGGRHVDIYLWNCNEALQLGRRAINLTVLRHGWSPQATRPSFVNRFFRQHEARASLPAVSSSR